MLNTTSQPWVMLNGQRQRLPVDGRRLIDWLRDDMGLTGTKEPCGAGQCGGCSVLLNGTIVPACCVLAITTAGQELTTIEGLARQQPGDRLLDTFMQCGATQCGYCTPGMIIAARAFLNSARPACTTNGCIDEPAVRHALAGNICRCTGYTQIVEAVLAAAHAEGLVDGIVDPPAWETVRAGD